MNAPLTYTEPTPSTNPYEGGRLMTTINCPDAHCTERVSVALADLNGVLRGSLVVMHTGREHWTRVYWGTDPRRVQHVGPPVRA